MFTVDEFQLIENRCWSDLGKFLKQISVAIPFNESSDKFKIYEKLSNEITKKMCGLLKSNSIVEGYIKLLKLGGISYDFSETDNELLEKIITNKEKILQGGMVEKNLPPQKPIDNFEIKISHAEKFSVLDLLAKISNLQTLLEGCVYAKKNYLRDRTEYFVPKNFYEMKKKFPNFADM